MHDIARVASPQYRAQLILHGGPWGATLPGTFWRGTQSCMGEAGGMPHCFSRSQGRARAFMHRLLSFMLCTTSSRYSFSSARGRDNVVWTNDFTISAVISNLARDWWLGWCSGVS